MLQVSDNANHQNNGAVLERKEGSYENVEHIAQKTTETFPMNTQKPEQELINDIKEFAANNCFKARIDGRQGMVCSRSATTSSRKKESGTIVCQRAETSIVSNCEWGVGWSKKRNFSQMYASHRSIRTTIMSATLVQRQSPRERVALPHHKPLLLSHRYLHHSS